MAPHSLRRRIIGLVLIVTALAVALSIGVRLRSYEVPLALITPCVLAVLSSALWLLSHVGEALTSTLHRCTVKGCTFQVRVQNVGPAEARRWREVATAHPAHRIVATPRRQGGNGA